MPMNTDTVILCATHRLVRSLQLQATPDNGIGEAPPAWLLADWLDRITEEAVLLGRAPAGGHLRLLAPLEERLVWRQVIEASLADRTDLALLDVRGLADTAAEAHALIEAWPLKPEGPMSEETRRFLGWRAEFHKLCRSRGWIDATRRLRWQVECIEAGACRLPAAVRLAGFDRLDPVQERLLAALRSAGTKVDSLPLGVAARNTPCALRLPDPDHELQQAIAWAGTLTAQQPGLRVGIVIPDLANMRERAAALLDNLLDPDALRPEHAERPRPYNISLGRPLASVPVIATALDLLRIAIAPRQVLQRDLGRLLNHPYWAGDQCEMTGRARLDARLRARLPFGTELDAVIRQARRLIVDGTLVGKTTDALEALRDAHDRLERQQRPSAHAASFLRLLKGAGWPGERPLSSHEFQAVQAFRETVARIARLDDLLGNPSTGNTSAGNVLASLTEACRDTLFQPKTEGRPAIQVLGLLEAALETFDALWVTGMTDQDWPPPARPNPLLPARQQRLAGSPHASPEVQSAFAAAIHARLCRAATTVIFSTAERDGDRELRASPLLAGLPTAAPEPPPGVRGDASAPDGHVGGFFRTQFGAHFAARVFAQLPAATERIELLADHTAPSVGEHEIVHGGTAILRAQALCPAWAYFRYRLQAKALETPVEGLDSGGRGTIAHHVLEAFWKTRSSAEVFGWPPATLQAHIDAAVAQGIAAYEADEEPLPSGFRALEAERLSQLVATWIEIERGRPDPFAVEACESEQTVDIHGVHARVIVDRIDRLADGRAVLLDYKTGSKVTLAGWAEARPSEPQLPIYAAYALAGQPLAAIAFAHLGSQPPRFVGLSDEAKILPEVKSLSESRRQFPESDFADWSDLLATWSDRLANLASEIRRGEAAVRYKRDSDLTYSDVQPLLRLAERRAQFELEAAAAGAATSPDSATIVPMTTMATTAAIAPQATAPDDTSPDNPRGATA